jgi:hypothetical protein
METEIDCRMQSNSSYAALPTPRPFSCPKAAVAHIRELPDFRDRARGADWSDALLATPHLRAATFLGSWTDADLRRADQHLQWRNPGRSRYGPHP